MFSHMLGSTLFACAMKDSQIKAVCSLVRLSGQNICKAYKTKTKLIGLNKITAFEAT